MTDALRDGRFVLLAPLGEGAQGRTFDGVDKREGKPVAIKRFDVARAKAWKDVELAEREARVLESLHHPKLPAYVDHFEEGGALYLVMEKIEGESVAALRKRGVGLGEADVVRFLRDASDVLAYLHGRSPSVIHRDLKPGNVIRRPDGSFAFVDFGAVRERLRPEGGSTVVGTFGFMAPEQFQGRAMPGSDVYAVGATALAMLTGREPEDLPHVGLGIDVREALRGQANERLVDVLAKMLDPNPDTRARSIAPLLERLDAPARGRTREKERKPWTYDFEARAREYEERARDYEGRVARGEPGRDEWLEGADIWREQAAQIREMYGREINRKARRAAKHATRAAKRFERRIARRAARHDRPWRTPFPFSLFVTLAFTAGMIGIRLGMQVIAPLVLTILSNFFARRALLETAAALRAGGDDAIESMRHGLAVMRGDVVPKVGPDEDERIRVEEVAPKTRVADEEDARGGEHEDDAEDAGERGASKRRGA